MYSPIRRGGTGGGKYAGILVVCLVLMECAVVPLSVVSAYMVGEAEDGNSDGHERPTAKRPAPLV